MYGMGVASIAEAIGGTIKEAQVIVDNFYKEFPLVKTWIDSTEEFAKTNGYVEDLWGRRRRLPDLKLNRFEVYEASSGGSQFNPLFGCKGTFRLTKSSKVLKYEDLADRCKTKKDSDILVNKARADGVIIRDNSGFISRSERQCVNARIQGSAATMSKKAMIAVHNDEHLNNLGFRLLIAVHDELIGECPNENAQAVADRLSQLMIEAGKPECTVPMKCDAEITHRWYESDYLDMIQSDYSKRRKCGIPREKCLKDIYEERPEASIFKLEKEIID